jgi:RNA 2',3'-cyclic 3'-phosphodiesterase
LFVGVVPPRDVLAALGGLLVDPRLRRASGELHATLQFLGEVDDPEAVIAGLRGATLPGATARAGPAVTRLGRQVLCVPVTGLDHLAAAVVVATGHPAEARPFHGHVTIARARGRDGIVPTAAAGQPVDLTWPVREVALVRSHLGGQGPRYDTLATFPVGGPVGLPGDLPAEGP